MKKKLEDFTILKYAIDQLMVASLNTDNVYTSHKRNMEEGIAKCYK